ncbi:MAG TPA: glucosamine-6-phosphate deaminase [Firmicutes bacterium]|nr:glucosamine-6-phosphate deaminase [Candidatus Fermentithermobacillaceae bacterium]
MKIIVAADYDEMSGLAAQTVAQSIKANPSAVLGLPTGSTPLGMYRNLIKMHKEGSLSFKNVTTFNLDEYVGLQKTHVNSFRYFMYENFFNHIDIQEGNINIPDGNSKDPEKECIAYEAKITNAGGIDLMVLGLGNNGHIGFNEPAGHFPASTHVAELDESTVQANARFFESIDEVPRFSITMGIGSIMRCRRILLLAGGQVKAPAIRGALEGPVTPALPGSVLQFHPNVTVVLDTGAASLLTSA